MIEGDQVTQGGERPSVDEGPGPSVGLFFPVMVVAGNLGIMISLIVLPTLGWWSLVAIGSLAFLVPGLVFGYWYLQGNKHKDGPS